MKLKTIRQVHSAYFMYSIGTKWFSLKGLQAVLMSNFLFFSFCVSLYVGLKLYGSYLQYLTATSHSGFPGWKVPTIHSDSSRWQFMAAVYGGSPRWQSTVVVRGASPRW